MLKIWSNRWSRNRRSWWKDKDAIYASTQDSIKLVKETNIDALAPALGSCHGLYKDAPKINYERMEEISKQTNIPLVLHGATGLDDETIKNQSNVEQPK